MSTRFQKPEQQFDINDAYQQLVEYHELSGNPREFSQSHWDARRGEDSDRAYEYHNTPPDSILVYRCSAGKVTQSRRVADEDFTKEVPDLRRSGWEHAGYLDPFATESEYLEAVASL